MDPEEDEWTPDDMHLLEDFISADDKQSAVDRTIRLIKDKFKTVDFKKIRPNRLG